MECNHTWPVLFIVVVLDFARTVADGSYTLSLFYACEHVLDKNYVHACRAIHAMHLLKTIKLILIKLIVLHEYLV